MEIIYKLKTLIKIKDIMKELTEYQILPQVAKKISSNPFFKILKKIKWILNLLLEAHRFNQ